MPEFKRAIDLELGDTIIAKKFLNSTEYPRKGEIYSYILNSDNDITFKVVAKNHPGYPQNSIVLMSEHVIDMMLWAPPLSIYNDSGSQTNMNIISTYTESLVFKTLASGFNISSKSPYKFAYPHQYTHSKYQQNTKNIDEFISDEELQVGNTNGLECDIKLPGFGYSMGRFSNIYKYIIPKIYKRRHSIIDFNKGVDDRSGHQLNNDLRHTTLHSPAFTFIPTVNEIFGTTNPELQFPALKNGTIRAVAYANPSTMSLYPVAVNVLDDKTILYYLDEEHPSKFSGYAITNSEFNGVIRRYEELEINKGSDKKQKIVANGVRVCMIVDGNTFFTAPYANKKWYIPEDINASHTGNTIKIHDMVPFLNGLTRGSLDDLKRYIGSIWIDGTPAGDRHNGHIYGNITVESDYKAESLDYSLLVSKNRESFTGKEAEKYVWGRGYYLNAAFAENPSKLDEFLVNATAKNLSGRIKVTVTSVAEDARHQTKHHTFEFDLDKTVQYNAQWKLGSASIDEQREYGTSNVVEKISTIKDPVDSMPPLMPITIANAVYLDKFRKCTLTDLIQEYAPYDIGHITWTSSDSQAVLMEDDTIMSNNAYYTTSGKFMGYVTKTKKYHPLPFYNQLSRQFYTPFLNRVIMVIANEWESYAADPNKVLDNSSSFSMQWSGMSTIGKRKLDVETDPPNNKIFHPLPPILQRFGFLRGGNAVVESTLLTNVSFVPMWHGPVMVTTSATTSSERRITHFYQMDEKYGYSKINIECNATNTPYLSDARSPEFYMPQFIALPGSNGLFIENTTKFGAGDHITRSMRQGVDKYTRVGRRLGSGANSHYLFKRNVEGHVSTFASGQPIMNTHSSMDHQINPFKTAIYFDKLNDSYTYHIFGISVDGKSITARSVKMIPDGRANQYLDMSAEATTSTAFTLGVVSGERNQIVALAIHKNYMYLLLESQRLMRFKLSTGKRANREYVEMDLDEAFHEIYAPYAADAMQASDKGILFTRSGNCDHNIRSYFYNFDKKINRRVHIYGNTIDIGSDPEAAFVKDPGGGLDNPLIYKRVQKKLDKFDDQSYYLDIENPLFKRGYKADVTNIYSDHENMTNRIRSLQFMNKCYCGDGFLRIFFKNPGTVHSIAFDIELEI